MAVWRTKACSLFGFKPGDYSFKQGKVDLFADLVAMADKAIRDGNEPLVARIIEYVTWAEAQDSDELDSVVDLAFFLPVFRDPWLSGQLQSRIPQQLFSKKWRLLVEDQ